MFKNMQIAIAPEYPKVIVKKIWQQSPNQVQRHNDVEI